MSGTIPVWSGSGVPSVVVLAQNNLEGPLPEKVVSHKLLTKLIVSFNQLNGSIPTTYDSLSQFSVDHNNFTGNFPFDPLNSLTALSVLDLSFNNLTGSIPSRFISVANSLSYLSIKGKAIFLFIFHCSLTNYVSLDIENKTYKYITSYLLFKLTLFIK